MPRPELPLRERRRLSGREHGTGMAMGCSVKADSLRAIHAEQLGTPAVEDPRAFFGRVRAAHESRDAASCLETARAYREHGVAVTPTLVARMPADPVLVDSVGMALLPPDVRTRWRQMAERGPGPVQDVLIDLARGGIRNVRLLYDQGVRLLAGTDLGNPFLVPGRSLHRELEVLVDSVGLSPLEALQAATIGPAEVFGMADSLGTISEGKLADVVLLSSNPLDDIRSVRSVEGVVLAGHYFDREELDALAEETDGMGG